MGATGNSHGMQGVELYGILGALPVCDLCPPAVNRNIGKPANSHLLIITCCDHLLTSEGGGV